MLDEERHRRFIWVVLMLNVLLEYAGGPPLPFYSGHPFLQTRVNSSGQDSLSQEIPLVNIRVEFINELLHLFES